MKNLTEEQEWYMRDHNVLLCNTATGTEYHIWKNPYRLRTSCGRDMHSAASWPPRDTGHLCLVCIKAYLADRRKRP